jgi:SnoaL-like domain
MLPSLSSPEFPHAFATEWIANWNARDVAAVVSHFRDDCLFESPIAEKITGKARLQGKAAVQKYWERALSGISSLHFTLDDCVWDPGRRTLVVVYTSLVDGRVTACTELMVFDADGRQYIGKAYYGAATTAQAASQKSSPAAAA